ncbi:MAG: hypothetical protein KA297_21660 [Kofleriaceae bacterium]|nr:hypothetical protein [Kofleriaceae bacterium]MBP6841638.1 hypothetical protein [Kofleriaceae bacterium]
MTDNASRAIGLVARTAPVHFAFAVVRLRQPADRPALLALGHALASVAGDALPAWLATIPAELPAAVRWVVVPWQPALGPALAAQREAVLAAQDRHGIDRAWFHQSTTRLRADVDDLPADAAGGDPDDDDRRWTAGPPPRRPAAPLPVDGLAAIDERAAGADLGIALKLAAPPEPGQDSVLHAFLSLWLAPYEGAVGQAGVVVDEAHGAVQLWASGLTGAIDTLHLVEHLFAVVGALHEVVPLVHGRFGAPSIEARREAAPFVFAGNPLLATWLEEGGRGVDAALAQPGPWSAREQAHMLRELAIKVTTPVATLPGLDEEFEALVADTEEPAPVAPPAAAPPRRRAPAVLAAELLAERAAADLLHRRGLDVLRPLLAQPDPGEVRRARVVRIVGAAGDPAAVPDLVAVLEACANPDGLIPSGRPELVAAVVDALATLAHPMAITALADLVVGSGAALDPVRAPALAALAACLLAPGGRRPISDKVVTAGLALTRSSDDLAAASAIWAMARLASTQEPTRLGRVRAALEATTASAPAPRLARQAGLRWLGASVAGYADELSALVRAHLEAGQHQAAAVLAALAEPWPGELAAPTLAALSEAPPLALRVLARRVRTGRGGRR